RPLGFERTREHVAAPGDSRPFEHRATERIQEVYALRLNVVHEEPIAEGPLGDRGLPEDRSLVRRRSAVHPPAEACARDLLHRFREWEDRAHARAGFQRLKVSDRDAPLDPLHGGHVALEASNPSEAAPSPESARIDRRPGKDPRRTE